MIVILAKTTSKSQLTLPKSLTTASLFRRILRRGGTQRQILLTPLHIQRDDAVRAELVELGLQEQRILMMQPHGRTGYPVKPLLQNRHKK